MGTYGNMWQNMATCGKMCALKTNYGKMQEDLWPLCKTNACPDPVWKPVNAGPLFAAGAERDMRRIRWAGGPRDLLAVTGLCDA